MATVYLALGSNVGNSTVHFDDALNLLRTQLTDIQESSRIITKAWGFTDQADFLNSVLRATTNLKPHQLLDFIKSVEQQVGRVERFRWGPREIDIDIIFYDDFVLNEPDLTIPHASFAEREFVLRPLQELAPNFIDPRSHQTITKLLATLPKE